MKSENNIKEVTDKEKYDNLRQRNMFQGDKIRKVYPSYMLLIKSTLEKNDGVELEKLKPAIVELLDSLHNEFDLLGKNIYCFG